MLSRQLFQFLVQYKYEVIFPIAIVEGPIITLVSGFLISLGVLSVLPTLIVVFAGDMISDSFYFLIGRHGRRYVERLFNISEERLKRLEEHFTAHPGKTLLLGKISYGVGSLFIIAAGASKMAYQKLLEYISPMNLLRSSALLLVGYSLGSAVRNFGVYLKYYTLLVIILLPMGYYIFKKVQEYRKGEPLI